MTLYQVLYREHGRSAKTKASIASVSPHVWNDTRAYDRVVAVLADSPDEAGQKLSAQILHNDNRPLAGLSSLSACAVRPLYVGNEVGTPQHGGDFDDHGTKRPWTRGVVTEVLGDDPATAAVGIHMFRDVRQGCDTVREWYLGPHGEKITVDFPVRHLAKIRVY